MLRLVFRAAASANRTPWNLSNPPIAAAGTAYCGGAQIPSLRSYASKNTKTALTQARKNKSKPNGKSKIDEVAFDDMASDLLDDDIRVRRLAEDEKDKSLDVGPNGRPLFTSTPLLSQLTREDTCTYMKFCLDNLNAVLPEGLPLGMVKEFEESKRNALLIRQSFLSLRDNFRLIVDPPMWFSDGKGNANEEDFL